MALYPVPQPKIEQPTAVSRTVGALSPATGVTVGLTGIAATGAIGSLTAAASLTISGEAATSALGSVTAAIAKAISGEAATSAEGSLAVGISVALSGEQATGAEGTLAPIAGYAANLTGIAATSAEGSLSAAIAVDLTGIAATGAEGTLTPVAGYQVAITGIAATSAEGSLSVDVSTALSGNEATSDLGSLSIGGEVARAPMGFYGVTFRKKKRRLEVKIDEDADKQSIADYIRAYLAKQDGSAPEIEINPDVIAKPAPNAPKDELSQFITEYLNKVAELQPPEDVIEEDEQDGIDLIEFLNEFLAETPEQQKQRLERERKQKLNAILAVILASEA